MKHLRIATVPYLNIAPFVASLEHRVETSVRRSEPSRLTGVWAEEKSDLCLLSAAELLRLGLGPLAGASISARGAVESVVLVSHTRVRRWRSVALDAASATSCRLAEIILEEKHGLRPAYVTIPRPVRALATGAVDAALVIGDPALELGAFPVRIDLALEWFRFTGLPFVFAAWVEGRSSNRERSELESLLAWARLDSRRWIPTATREHSARSGLPRERLDRYLRERISYRFGRDERAGLATFRALLHRRAEATADLALEMPLEGRTA